MYACIHVCVYNIMSVCVCMYVSFSMCAHSNEFMLVCMHVFILVCIVYSYMCVFWLSMRITHRFPKVFDFCIDSNLACRDCSSFINDATDLYKIQIYQNYLWIYGFPGFSQRFSVFSLSQEFQDSNASLWEPDIHSSSIGSQLTYIVSVLDEA